ncbi:ISNCY family transposase, partial [Salmonella enterica subsp. enterica]|nr:ISNCY family transposase [Salmonella enterica subsp. enterica]
RQEGRLEGRQEAIQQMVRTMLTNGADHETIMKLTGLSAEELANIIH